MVSTHWRRPGRPPGRDMRMLELFGDLVGETVARHLEPAYGPALLRQAGSDGDDPWYQSDGELSQPGTELEEFAGEVVRRLFAAGLSLASAQAIIGDGAAGDRVATAVDELDRTIRDIDPDTHQGWSVVVTGTAHLVADLGEVARYQRMLTPWAGGEMGQVIRIRPAIVTGFRFSGQVGSGDMTGS